MKLKKDVLDLNVHACENGFYVTTRTNDCNSPLAAQATNEYVFANLTEMFKFFKEHFLHENWRYTNNPWDTDGSAVYGGGS